MDDSSAPENPDHAEGSGSDGTVDVHASRQRTPSTALPWAVAALLAVVTIGLVVALLSALRANDERLEDLADAVDGLDQHVGDVARRVDALGAQVAASSTVSGETSSPSTPSSTGIEGGLPLFESTQNDPAVLNGMILGTVTGAEYYTGQQASFSPDDATARVWVVWAHWCPYCQAELPEVSAWYSNNATDYPNTELVSVTTSIDPGRGNPLETYLDESQFPFPVLVDADYRLASQFGTSAFPYWVVTDSTGRVMLRVAGTMGIDRVEQIFVQLEEITAGA
jgi:thiol-disulfide isomerase/thioredoxin